MLNNIKIAFFDLDGTLTNNNKIITPNTIDAIRKLKEKNITIVYCSGRWDTYLLDFDKELNLVDYIICNNGANIYDVKNNQVIKDNSMPLYLVNEIIEYCSNHNLELIFNGLLSRYLSNGEALNKIKKPLYQAVIICKNKNQVDNLLIHLNDNQDIYISYISSAYYKNTQNSNYTLNINLRDTNKGRAVKALISYLNLTKEDSICFGDNNNDLSMFDACGIKVAMSNGSDEIKNKATFITLDNNSDGVAYFINNNIDS